jgi:pimeloyl-ACP methyl ester carboxylesterase
LIVLRDQAPAAEETLIVLLPGAYMTPADFVAAGFVAALRRRGLAVDVAIATLDLASVSDGSCLSELRQQLIVPARQGGYRDIWLGGISLGGFLALSYAEHYPGEIDGLCLLSPYPGNRMTTSEIEAAGGVEHWRASAASLSDPEYRVWHWLATCRDKPPVFMAYGCEDRFARGMALMASAFPGEQVTTRAGGHDWPTWRRLWDDFVDAVSCRCA